MTIWRLSHYIINMSSFLITFQVVVNADGCIEIRKRNWLARDFLSLFSWQSLCRFLFGYYSRVNISLKIWDILSGSCQSMVWKPSSLCEQRRQVEGFLLFFAVLHWLNCHFLLLKFCHCCIKHDWGWWHPIWRPIILPLSYNYFRF